MEITTESTDASDGVWSDHRPPDRLAIVERQQAVAVDGLYDHSWDRSAHSLPPPTEEPMPPGLPITAA